MKSLCLAWVRASKTILYDQDGASIMVSPELDTAPYFHGISAQLKAFSSIVLLGPDMTKFHLRIFLQEQKPELYRRIVGFETISDFHSLQTQHFLQKYGLIDNALLEL